jgi:hypothetical protein
MKSKCFVILLFFVFQLMSAQTELIKVNAKLETESFHRTIVSGTKINFLRAIESNEVTEKVFLLSQYNLELKLIWEKKLVVNQYQNIISFNKIDNKLNIFFVNHDLDNQLSELSVKSFFIDTGEQYTAQTLWNSKIGKWEEIKGKAVVAQSFLSAMDAVQSENDVTPLEYRYSFGFSPDSSKCYAYRIDNSLEVLRVEMKIFTSNEFVPLVEVHYSIDDASFAYGAKIDDLGDIYQLTVSGSNKLAVMKVNWDGEVVNYLQIPSGSTQKTNPQLYIHKTHQAYVAYTNVKNDVLQGLSVALLDFDFNKIEDSHYYHFNEDFLKRQETKLRNGNHFFELSDIEEHHDHLIMVLEQHFIEGVDVYYEPNAGEVLSHWHQKNAFVTTGNMIVVVFDKELNNISCLEIAKKQKGNVMDGLNTLGHHLVFKNNEMFFIYTNSKKDIVNDQLIIQKLDKSDMKWAEYRKVQLEKSLYPVITSSNIIEDGKILVHTRKGLLAKDNYLKIYEF